MFNWIGSQPFAKCSITIRRDLECLSHNTPSWRRQFLKIKKKKKKRLEIAQLLLLSNKSKELELNVQINCLGPGEWPNYPVPVALVLRYFRRQSQERKMQGFRPVLSTRAILILFIFHCVTITHDKRTSCCFNNNNKTVCWKCTRWKMSVKKGPMIPSMWIVQRRQIYRDRK